MKEGVSARRVLLLCFMTYSVVYIGRQNISIASPLLESGGVLGKEQIGTLGSIFFLVYAIGRIINGKIGDQFPPKPFLAVGLLLSALCNLGFSLLPPVGVMYGIWGLNGFFQSMLWGAALCNVSMAYPDGVMAKRAAVVLSISVGVGSLLGVVLPTLFSGFGVRAVFGIPGLILLGMSLLLLFCLPSHRGMDRPKQNPGIRFSCLRNKELRSMLLPSLIHGAVKENLTLWFPLFFIDAYGMDLTSAAFYIFLMPVATLLGRLVFPAWHRMCRGNDRLTLITAFLACGALLAPFLFGHLPIWLAAALLALVSVLISVINAELIGVYPINYQSANEVSTVSGILDCAVYIGAALGSVFFGYLLSSTGYDIMLAICGLLSAIAILPMLFKSSEQHSEP